MAKKIKAIKMDFRHNSELAGFTEQAIKHWAQHSKRIREIFIDWADDRGDRSDYMVMITVDDGEATKISTVRVR